ncbi:MAG: D-galactosamine 6-phosphate deaminase/isomerase [Acidobacteriota bacterium]|jgi:tagatose-6-phosphate ketose/aldose isomerase
MQKNYSLTELLELPTTERESLGVAHTLQEILQQPQTWGDTFEKIVGVAQSIETFLFGAGIDVAATTPLHVFLVGAGTSDYIGKSVRALLQREWRCDVQAIPSTDLLTNMEDHIIAGHNYLWLSFSRSGDSSEGVAVLETALAEYPQIKHVIVTCNSKGKMASFAARENVFSIVLDDDINDRGLAMTSSFSNMVIVAQALAHFRRLGTYSPIVKTLAGSAYVTLPLVATTCERLVSEGFAKVCFLGTGPLKGAAIESALKVLELTGGRVMGFAESFLGLRHGPLSAIDNDTLVVGFLSADARRRSFESDLLQEICDKHLTQKCLTVASKNVETAGNSLSFEIEKDISDLYLPPLFVLVGQFLGLFASLKEGLRPDEPSPQGAISRVVSHVSIY